MATMTMMPTSILPGPRATSPTPTPRAVDDASADALAAMFPDVERAVLAQLLVYHDNDLGRVVDMMLDTGGADADVDVARQLQDVGDSDADVARRLQDEQDEEVAKALHASLQAELKAEDEAKRQKALPAVATRTVSSASVRAKKFLMQRMPRSSTGRQQTSTHETRLLEPLEGESDGGASYDLRPLDVSEYAPPALTTEGAPSPPAGDGAASVDSGARYNARLDRARSANRVRAQSRLSSSSSPESQHESTVVPLPPAAAPPAVPEEGLLVVI